ncbi:MAG: RidA family protein [Deltaproteobacteria bacterium]|nr:RidA family protein [Candidatus Anaeroferrophillacea bacterium]
MKVRTIHTGRAPQAVGPYSQAVWAHGFVFVSGQLGLDPESGRLVPGGVEAEARQALGNAGEILAAAGCGRDDVVKVTVLLRDMGDFAAVNAIYAEFFGGHRPARAAFAVAGLPLDGRIEVEMIAAAG